MNEHDRTPAPPLAEADLQRIEQEFRSGETYSEDLPRFIASLRAAWAERDEFRASFLELFETTRRYREALVEIRDRRPVWGILEGPYDGAETWVDAISRLCKVAAVALATPGAGDPATTEERGSSS